MTEPSVFITDLMLAITAGFWGRQLHRQHFLYGGRPLKYWIIIFYSISFGAVFGGIYAGFSGSLPVLAKSLLLKSTWLLIGITGFGFLGVWIESFSRTIPRGLIFLVAFIYLIIYSVLILKTENMIYLIGYYLPIIILVFFSFLFSHLKNTGNRTRFFVIGLGICLVGIVIQVSGLSIHRYFNQNDLYHLFQIAGLYVIYSRALTIG